jgi:two-component SAPR family response regulator
MDRILQRAWIIDNDEIYRFGFQKFVTMKFCGKEVVGFDNGKNAFNFLIDPLNNDRLPDIIFLNCDMPVMNGWEFLTAFSDIKSQLDKHITIIMVTSSINYADIVRANSSEDITYYMVKPIDYQQFSSAFNADTRQLA